MENPEWLSDVSGDSVLAVVAILYRYGVHPRRARDLAEEYIQEARYRACRKKREFESRMHCHRWLVKVAMRYAIQVFRQELRRRQHLEELLSDRQSSGDAASRSVPSPLQELLGDALTELAERDRQVIALRFFEGLPLKVIASTFGHSTVSAHRRVRAALRRLKEVLIRRRDELDSR